MAPFTGLGIEIISGGTATELYNDPDQELDQDSRNRQQYVEAVTGAKFRVKVSLYKPFKIFSLKSDDAVRVTVYYDNQFGWYHEFTGEYLLHRLPKGKPVEHYFSSISRYDQVSQQWMQGDLCFGALDTKDNADTKSSPEKLKSLGRIQVKVQRVLRTVRAVPSHCPKIMEKPITEVSEKMLKGKAVTNTVRTTGDCVSTEPPTSNYDTTPMPGSEGEPLITDIFYRSKRTLQMLGCIPRTPSPEPESRTVDASVSDREQKIQDLQAQLALLENANGIKAEGSDARRRIKRDLEDTEDLEVTEIRSANKRSRTSGPVETVDLTED